MGVSCAKTDGQSATSSIDLDVLHFNSTPKNCMLSDHVFGLVFAGRIVLEALILTSAVVSSLTGYTFWASKKGKDFSFLGPVLFASLIILILTSFMQVKFICFFKSNAYLITFFWQLA